MKKRLAAFLLVLALLGTAAPAALAANWRNPFTDVAQNDWFYGGVEYVCSKGLFTGATSTAFQPEDSMTRAMLVTCLWRLDGCPDAAESPFSDVPAGQYYSSAVAWASANSIVNGKDGHRFDPDGNITREELVAVLLRYCQYGGKAPAERADLSRFADLMQVSGYAKDAFAWSAAAGILTGIESGGFSLLNPQGSASRCEVAVALMRFDKYLNSESPAIPAVRAEDSLTISGKAYFIGMSEAQLTALAGAADDSFPSVYGYSCRVYGTKDYSSFFMAGIQDGRVVTLCSAGTGFSYMGKGAGATGCSFSGSATTQVNAMTDENDNDALHCIQLTEKGFSAPAVYNSETLYGEARLNFHLVNAFRQQHGLPAFIWCGKAAAAARLHSEDMAGNRYFSHDSLDGRNAGDRMQAQGAQITYAWSENIIAGYGAAIASHNGWVNSSGHRDNILNRWTRFLGVGFAYAANSPYRIYATEDFYS